MESHIFYQEEANAPIQLVLVNTLNEVLKSELASVNLQRFEAKSGEVAYINNNKNNQLSKVYVGLGHGADKVAVAKAVTMLPEGAYQPKTPLSQAANVIWSLAQYQFDAYKQAAHAPRVLVLPTADYEEVLAESSAIFKVRDLINAPANHMGPKALADTIKTLGQSHGAKVKIITGDTLLKQNFPAVHAVGNGAAEAPRLVILNWGNPKHPKVSLVGKGVCFDSGGLDIKPARAMRLMKKDMGGAANAIGLAHWIMSVKLPIYLELLIPAVENAVSRDAYRPGDVLTMRSGLTVEIDNTDAEGRLVLADALTKACENAPELLIDFATLTGAARVAVGTDIAAMFSNDDAFAKGVEDAAYEVDDPVCRLPLFQPYHSLFQSKIADLANSSASPYAGAITAALFLERFITADIKWMHFDCMAWNTKSVPGKPEGGEAMAISAVMRYLLCQYKPD